MLVLLNPFMDAQWQINEFTSTLPFLFIFFFDDLNKVRNAFLVQWPGLKSSGSMHSNSLNDNTDRIFIVRSTNLSIICNGIFTRHEIKLMQHKKPIIQHSMQLKRFFLFHFVLSLVMSLKAPWFDNHLIRQNSFNKDMSKCISIFFSSLAHK